MSGFLLRLTLLAAVWLLALGDISAGNLLVGLLVSAGLLWLLGYHRQDRSSDHLGRRILRSGPFLLAIIREVAVGTWAVSLVILGQRQATPGYVEVLVGPRTPNGVAVTAWLTTLIPGSAFVSVDDERGVMLFHVLDAADPEVFRSDLDRVYQRYQRHVFP